MPVEQPEVPVATLLRAAGITVSEDELLRLSASYVHLRRLADDLYSTEFDADVPAVVFDPTVE